MALNKNLTSYSVVDHSVTKEKFTLVYDRELDMWRTIPRPSQDELPRFYESKEYISHTDSSSSLTEKLYQLVKRYMFQYKFNLIKQYNKEGKLLDIGAGTGDFLVEAKKRNWKAKGVEPNASARSLAAFKNIDLYNDLSQINETYEVITLWHVLEHIYHLDVYLDFLKKHLAKSGTLYIAVPNFNSYDAKKYKSYWAAYDVPRHLYHFSQTAIKKIFEEHGLKLVNVKPLWFDSFYVSILSEHYRKSNFQFIRGILTALYSNLSALRTKEYSSLIYVLKHKEKSK